MIDVAGVDKRVAFAPHNIEAVAFHAVEREAGISAGDLFNVSSASCSETFISLDIDKAI